MKPYLSKSDFKVASSCATKLFYKKNRYPTTLDDDPFMELLADGGFMVGKFAQLQEPDGVMVEEADIDGALKRTADLMSADDVTLFEGAFFAGGCLARVDILKKRENRLQIIEVKSKGYDPDEGLTTRKGTVRSEWIEYLEDVAFQRMVVGRCNPDAIIECFLLLPDKSATAEIDLLTKLPTGALSPSSSLKKAARTLSFLSPSKSWLPS
jgi:hypothetical protein